MRYKYFKEESFWEENIYRIGNIYSIKVFLKFFKVFLNIINKRFFFNYMLYYIFNYYLFINFIFC